jgi:hypothetical protein
MAIQNHYPQPGAAVCPQEGEFIRLKFGPLFDGCASAARG